MYIYSREFPTKIIPHITEFGVINDNIHNYKRPKMKESTNVSKIESPQKQSFSKSKTKEIKPPPPKKTIEDEEDDDIEVPVKREKP